MDRRVRVRLWVTLVAALALFVAGTPGSLADTGPKGAVVVTAPDPVGAGTTTPFTVSFTNLSIQQILGSANLTVPPGFLLLSAELKAPIHSPAATATVSGDTVLLRNIDIDPGLTQEITVRAIAACEPSTPVTRSWVVRMKQSNDFSGDAGNDIPLAEGSDLTTSVIGTCEVGYAGVGFSRGPASAETNATITSQEFTPTGAPVAVGLFDDDGKLITAASFATTVTIGLEVNPGGGQLSGDLSEPTTEGIAEFPGISIDRTGLGYRLSASASSSGVSSGTSGPFDIVDDGKVCGSSTCTGSATLGNTSTTLSTDDHEAGDRLFVVLNVESLNCPDFVEVSAVVTFNVTTEGGITTVQITVARKGLPTARRSLSSMMVCYAAPKPFTIRSGGQSPQVGGEYVGLLPECLNVGGTAPCVASRTKTSKTYTITFVAPTGDPKGRT